MIILLPLSAVYAVGIYRVIKGSGKEPIEVLLVSDAVLTIGLGLVSLVVPTLAVALAFLAAFSSIYYPTSPIGGN